MAEQDAQDFDDDLPPGDEGADGAAQTDDQVDDAQDDQAIGDDQSPDGGDGTGQDDGADAQLAAAEKRRQTIEERARATREENARIASETAAATARGVAEATRQATVQAEQEKQEREALAGMTDEQRATYLLAKKTKSLEDTQNTTQRYMRSTADQVAFTRTLSRKPQYAKYETEVENRHQAILAQGGFTARDVILAHLIGEKALKAENTQNQRDAAQRRVQQQRGNPGNRTAPRGDAAGNKTSNAGSNVVKRAESENWAI